jgi:hypothetical protein
MTASATTLEDAAARGSSSNAYPRMATLWAALACIVSAMTLAWPALGGKFLVGPHSDQYIAGYPFREFAARTLRDTGSFPLWNPYQFGGMPFVAAMHGDIFYPTFLLRMIMPTDVAMTWGFIIHLILAGLFTFILLRRMGFGFAGALIGGLAYMMGGQVASLVSPGHDGKMFVSALFPILLWSLIAGVRDGRRWAWGVLALVVGLDVLSPHPQLLQYSLLAGGAYAIFLATREVKAKRLAGAEAIKRLAFALVGVILGGVIGAVQYLPVREYVAWSPRAGGIGSYEHATSFAWNPQELFNVYLPQFTGILEAYWGPNGIHFHSEYIGVVTLVLAGAAFIGLRGDNKRGEIWFWTITLVVTVLWSLGAATPFYKLPYYLIPGTKYFRAPATIFFVGTLGISVLVASGVEKVLAGRVGNKYVIGWLIFGVLVAVLAVTGGLSNFAASIAPQERPDAYERILANNGALIGGSLRALLFVVLTAAVIFTTKTGQLPRKVAAAALAVLCVVDLWSILQKYWIFSPPAAQLYASNPAIDFLRKQPQPVRVFAVGDGDAADYSGAGLMIHDIRNVGGYHGNQIGRYNELTGVQGGPNELFRFLLNPNGQRLTNTQFIMTNLDQVGEILSKAAPDAKLAFGPVKDAQGEDTYIYRLPADAPFAWVAPVIIKAPDDQVLQTVLDPRFDVTRAALFDTSASVTAQTGLTTLPPETGVGVHVDKYEPGHVLMTLSAPAPAGSALLASENYYPGWKATVDGKPAKIGRAQYSLIGVELPAGARKVELSFGSATYETGKMLTWIALFLTALLIAGGLIAERRRSE